MNINPADFSTGARQSVSAAMLSGTVSDSASASITDGMSASKPDSNPTTPAAVHSRHSSQRDRETIRDSADGGRPSYPRPAAKEPKNVIPGTIEPDLPPVVYEFYAGYQSLYVYRGFETVGGFAAPGGDYDRGIVMAGFNARFRNGFALSLGYISGVDSVAPRFGGVGPTNYQEWIFGVSYTANITNDLLFTAGATYFYFPERQFWSTSDQLMLSGTLAYRKFALFRPSVTFERYLSGFDQADARGIDVGSMINFRVDGGTNIASFGSVKLGFAYAMDVNYDMNYNVAGNGWCNYQASVSLPISLTNNLTIVPTYWHSWDLGENRGYEGGWFGVTAKFLF